MPELFEEYICPDCGEIIPWEMIEAAPQYILTWQISKMQKWAMRFTVLGLERDGLTIFIR